MSCGPTPVCTDVGNTLQGHVHVEDGFIHISWSTDAENANVTSYAVQRWPKTAPTNKTLVATIAPHGACESAQDYAIDDYAATPLSQWGYTVSVMAGTTVACAHDVTPS